VKEVVRYSEAFKQRLVEDIAGGKYTSIEAAWRRIRELEAALADAHREYRLESAFLDIACEKLGTSAEE
jgi:transposase-like protein